jgi:hypothetical protein
MFTLLYFPSFLHPLIRKCSVQIGISIIAHHVGMVSLLVLGCDHCFVGMIMSKLWVQAIFQLNSHTTFCQAGPDPEKQSCGVKGRVLVKQHEVSKCSTYRRLIRRETE